MAWKPTPVERRIVAERWPDGERVDYDELRPGDIFRAVSPEGEYVDPFSFEPSESVSIARAMPQKLTADVQRQGYLLDSQIEGFCLEVDTYETLADALKSVAN